MLPFVAAPGLGGLLSQALEAKGGPGCQPRLWSDTGVCIEEADLLGASGGSCRTACSLRSVPQLTNCSQTHGLPQRSEGGRGSSLPVRDCDPGVSLPPRGCGTREQGFRSVQMESDF